MNNTAQAPATKHVLPDLEAKLTSAATAELESKVAKIIRDTREAIRKELNWHELYIQVVCLSVGGRRIGDPARTDIGTTASELLNALEATLNVGAKEHYVDQYKDRFLTRITELEKRLEETQAELENLRGGQ